MLRSALLAVAMVIAVLGVWLRFTGHPSATPIVIWGCVLLVAVLIERWRYRPTSPSASTEWLKTEERFIDPESGSLTEVFYNPRTGERRYQAASQSPAELKNDA